MSWSGVEFEGFDSYKGRKLKPDEIVFNVYKDGELESQYVAAAMLVKESILAYCRTMFPYAILRIEMWNRKYPHPRLFLDKDAG